MTEKAQADKATAVVFIHGQGEQQPMEGARELARTMWDAAPGARWSWVAPDGRLDLPDLGVVQARSEVHGRADFYEFYWAHRIVGSSAAQALEFIQRLMERPRSEAPKNLLPLRQWTIRLLEFAWLSTVVFIAAVAEMLPLDRPACPTASPVAPIRVFDPCRDTLYGDFWTLLNNLVEYVDWGAALLFAAAFAKLIANEFSGGHRREAPPKSTDDLPKKGWWRLMRARAAFVMLPIALVVIMVLITRQTGAVDGSDFRLLMIILAATACFFALDRKLTSAAAIGAVGALLAMIAASWGPLDLTSERNTAMGFGWFIAIFAPLWFLSGLLRIVSCAPQERWQQRVISTLAIIIVAYGVSYIIQDELKAINYSPVLSLAYGVGATILTLDMLIIVCGYIVSRTFLRPIMADSARYLSRNPDNVKAREEVRKSGLRLLRWLHSCGEYDRIVIVAHSLGSIVGYELLSDFWARRCATGACTTPQFKPVTDAIDTWEAAVAAAKARPEGSDEMKGLTEAKAAFERAQAAYQDSLSRNGFTKTWLITDFITLGSPLTNGELLLAESPNYFEIRKEKLELATAPPRHGGSRKRVRDVAMNKANARRSDAPPPVVTDEEPHHGAVFAAVRWKNLFFEVGFPIHAGDLIGGPVAPMFGHGVQDGSLDHRATGYVFAHNEYWTSPLPTKELEQKLPVHLYKLSRAIELR